MKEVKQRKMITLDYDVWYKLQREDNASDLINTLLIQHYEKTDKRLPSLTPEELQELKEKHQQYKMLEAELKERLG
jgi:predicted CopG family antitoxin